METLILLSVKELAVAATIGQLNSYNRMKAKRVKVENPPPPFPNRKEGTTHSLDGSSHTNQGSQDHSLGETPYLADSNWWQKSTVFIYIRGYDSQL